MKSILIDIVDWIKSLYLPLAPVEIVVAMDMNGAIGKEGKLPWHLPADMKFFRGLTAGHTVVMGRKTYESIGKKLEGRANCIVTRDESWSAEGVEVWHDWKRDLRKARLNSNKPILIVGGAEIYELFLPVAQKLHITRIVADIDNPDTYFPVAAWKYYLWDLTSKSLQYKDSHNQFFMFFETWTKVES